MTMNWKEKKRRTSAICCLNYQEPRNLAGQVWTGLKTSQVLMPFLSRSLLPWAAAIESNEILVHPNGKQGKEHSAPASG